ncbi:MAG: hypothetical protein RIR49_1583 [Actinomycetota bacterium]|jgi:uncharacterized repeat protein (TIGR03843 family)
MDPLAFLEHGEIEIEGRMPWSSNATFAVVVRCGDDEHRAIYKPLRGERPLWDFEPGLHRRERAAYLLSRHLGLDVVPPTILRDGPFGPGSLQWFVEADHREHYFTIFEQRPELHPRLRDIAVFDVAANNTDRKSGHCLLADDEVWAIDNGLCFAAPFKLRTVIWEFAGQTIPAATLARLAAVAENPPLDLTTLLTDDEVDALRHRCGQLVETEILPIDETGQRYPWPLV